MIHLARFPIETDLEANAPSLILGYVNKLIDGETGRLAPRCRDEPVPYGFIEFRELLGGQELHHLEDLLLDILFFSHR